METGPHRRGVLGVRYDVDMVFVRLGILRGSSGGVAMVMTLGTAVANLGRNGDNPQD